MDELSHALIYNSSIARTVKTLGLIFVKNNFLSTHKQNLITKQSVRNRFQTKRQNKLKRITYVRNIEKIQN